MWNEADVVRASAQHLVYPINILLPEPFPSSNLYIVCTNLITATSPRFDKSDLSPSDRSLRQSGTMEDRNGNYKTKLPDLWSKICGARNRTLCYALKIHLLPAYLLGEQIIISCSSQKSSMTV